MKGMFSPPIFRTAPVRSSLSEFAGPGLEVLRTCDFSFAAKILTLVDDILVPFMSESALDDLLAQTGIRGVVTTHALSHLVPEALGLAVAEDPMQAHHEIHLALSRMPGRLWRDFPSEIDPTAEIHPTAWLAPQNVRIGPGAVIMPHAVVHERCVIGARSRIHSHTVIGGDAYEIIMVDGRQRLRPQTGGVAIGMDCEILAGSIVTRSAFCGATVIDDHTVLDCNVTVSHDCHIGADVRIGGSSWLGGRVKIGDRVTLGPNCTIGNGLVVGERAKVSIGAVVTRDVPSHGQVSGNFAIEHTKLIEHLRSIR